MQSLKARRTRSSEVEGVLTQRREALDQADQSTYPICQSVWDMCMAVGSGSAGVCTDLDSASALLTFMLNLLVQLVFIFQVPNLVDKHAFSRQQNQYLLEWRLRVGHAAYYYDGTTDSSLVSRVCGEYPSDGHSADQIRMLSDIRAFVGGSTLGTPGLTLFDFIGPGHVLCTLCVFLWLLMILEEMWKTFMFANAMCTLTEGLSRLSYKAGMYRVESVSAARCVLIQLFVTVPRMFIATLLGYEGVFFILYSVTMGDMLLNAMALGFILELDELLFAALAPKRLQAILESVAPLPCSTGRHRRLWRTGHLIKHVVLLSTVTALSFTLLQSHFDMMREMEEVMCGGNVDFVCNPSEPMGTLKCSLTDSWRSSGAVGKVVGGYEGSAVLRLTGLSIPEAQRLTAADNNATGVLWTPAGAVLSGMKETRAESLGRVMCADTWDTASELTVPGRQEVDILRAAVLQDPVFQELGVARSCAEVLAAGLCDQRRRLLAGLPSFAFQTVCALSCGCTDPLSGLANALGCPTQCVDRRREALDAALFRCRDASLEELRASAGWGRQARAADPATRRLMAEGCAAAVQSSALCRPSARTSILAFCPASCNACSPK